MRAVKYRAGVQGVMNVLLGAVFAPVFAVLLVISCAQVSRGVDVGWSGFAAFVSLVACGAMVATMLSGVSSCRAVVLTPTELSLPGFTLRRGFYRDTVALVDISDVALKYHSNRRNGRWQLVVKPMHGRPIACDSVTTSRSRTDPRNTRAWHVVNSLRTASRAARSEAA